VSADAHDIQDTTSGAAAAPPSRARHLSIEERRRLVADSLRIGNPVNNARDLPAEADPRCECQIELKVADIRPYEHNPRRAGNAKFAEIKASIRAAGIRTPLTVTRRPGDTHFIVESGGNTRLLAVQQLWAETGDSRYEKLTVVFRPWRSESHVLTAHMVENELRGEMTFCDRAAAIAAIKAHLEAQSGSALSLRQLETALKAIGLATNPTTLSHYLFVSERLRVLVEAIPELSAQDVKTIQPRLNALKRHAQVRAGIAEVTLYESLFDPLIREAADRYLQGQGFSAAQLCDACEVAVARHLDLPIAELRSEINALSRPSQGEVGKIAQSPARAANSVCAPSPDTGPDPRSPPVVNGVDSRSAQGVPPAAAKLLPSAAGHRHARAAITELAQRLAQLAGIDEHLRSDPSAPLGFRMTGEPLIEQDLRPHARRAWWLLSHFARARSDPRSAGFPGATSEGSLAASSADPESSASAAMQTDATSLLDWLLDPDDSLAGAALQFLNRLRGWRMSQGSCAADAGARPDAKAGV
jgi:ParB family protein of integrating conjugative element (PFGI_1 class)